MKKCFLTMACFVMVFFAAAQKEPLNGSDRILLKNFNYTGFNKLELYDLAGKVEVSIGAVYAIDIAIDDNLENLLQVTNKNNTLSIGLKGNRQNRLYIESTNIVIKISMPLITAIKQNGNNSLQVTNIAGKSLKVKCTGNGNVHLSGTADELNIVCAGNGNVNAAKLIAKNVQVTKRGNGSVIINTGYTFSAFGFGNGEVTNTGIGLPDNNSAIRGNGTINYMGANELIQKNNGQNKGETGNRVNVIIKNPGQTLVSLVIQYPVKGSYGIDVKPQDSVTEQLPAGTKIYRSGQFRAMAKPLFSITTADTGHTFTLPASRINAVVKPQ